MALRPDAGGTRIERLPADAGYRRYYGYVGDFWGPRYHQRVDVPRSAMALPDARDVRALVSRLRDAGEAQRVCYGWRIDIRSGRRKGRFEGPPGSATCDPYLRLVGWIDPNAGRLRRKGSPGDWAFSYEWTLSEGELRRESMKAIDVPLVEMLEGATQQPSGDGTRAGRGLIELIDSLPLLALDFPGIPPAPVTTGRAPAGARIAPAERSDAERRAEDSWVSLPPALLRVGAGFAIAVVLLGVTVAGLRRWWARLRALAS